MNSNIEPANHEPGEVTSIAALGGRITWALIGPMALLGVAYGIVSGGAGWLTALDAVFAGVVGLMILGRWVDQRSGSGLTLTGEPATESQLRRYVTMLMAVACVVWVIANVAGNHVLN